MIQEPTNVISIKTRKQLLPFQIRAIAMAQYMESVEKGEKADTFILALEEKLLVAGAASILGSIKEFFAAATKERP